MWFRVALQHPLHRLRGCHHLYMVRWPELCETKVWQAGCHRSYSSKTTTAHIPNLTEPKICQIREHKTPGNQASDVIIVAYISMASVSGGISLRCKNQLFAVEYSNVFTSYSAWLHNTACTTHYWCWPSASQPSWTRTVQVYKVMLIMVSSVTTARNIKGCRKSHLPYPEIKWNPFRYTYISSGYSFGLWVLWLIVSGLWFLQALGGARHVSKQWKAWVNWPHDPQLRRITAGGISVKLQRRFQNATDETVWSSP